jgi:hypothetical protein
VNSAQRDGRYDKLSNSVTADVTVVIEVGNDATVAGDDDLANQLPAEIARLIASDNAAW